MSGINAYFDAIHQHLTRVEQEEAASIEAAVSLLVEAIKSDHNIFVFGASHAGILSNELTYRAGGLATINPVEVPELNLATRPITETSRMEREPGFGTRIASSIPLSKGDVVITHSVSGRNTVMIDFAQAVKAKGSSIIAITNMTYSKGVNSRHPSGLRLFEISDVVIDNHGVEGDAVIKFESLPQQVGPTSTVVGAAIVNSIVVGVTEALLAQGLNPPIFFSANLDGGDEHNQKIFKQYKKHIFYM